MKYFTLFTFHLTYIPVLIKQ